MGVALLCGPPGQVIEEVIAALAVHACGIVLTVTLRIHLQDQNKSTAELQQQLSFRNKQAELLSVLLLPRQDLQLCAYLHALFSSTVFRVWQAAVGMTVTHAAAHHPHLVDGIKPAEGSTRQPGNITEAGHPHPESRQP